MRFKFHTIFFVLIQAAFFLGTMGCLTCFSACSIGMQNLENEEVLFVLPQWPPEDSLRALYPEIAGWRVEVESAEKSETIWLERGEQNVRLECRKNKPVTLVVTPVAPDFNDFFYPAGGVYPFMFEGNCVQVDWEAGFMASIIQKLFLGRKETGVSAAAISDFVSRFNWTKFDETIRKKISESQEKFYNPWLVNQPQLFDNLCYGDFRATLLNNQYVYAFAIDSGDTMISQFIPENQFIFEKHTLSLKKDEEQLFVHPLEETRGENPSSEVILAKCSSQKKVSLQKIFLPIYIEGL